MNGYKYNGWRAINIAKVVYDELTGRREVFSRDALKADLLYALTTGPVEVDDKIPRVENSPTLAKRF